MANYLQADYVPEDKLFVPNYNLINMTLQARQSQYDQGFAQVKGLYNSVLNSKATNAGNIQQQGVYLKNIQDSLKNLPSVDLSVSKNVSAANDIFNPFYEDQELMRDIGITKISGSELSKGQSFLTSDDAKKRAMHSSISDEYVGIPLDELRRGQRGDGSLMAVKPRYYVPAVDLGEKFKSFLTDKGLSVFSDTRDGKGTILRSTNGKLQEAPLRSLFDGLVTGDDRKYFDAWGEVLYNRQVNGYMGQGMGEKEAKLNISKDLATQTKNYYQEELTSNQSALARATTAWADYKSLNGVNGQVPQSEDAFRLKSNVMFYQQQVDDHKLKLNQFDFNKVSNEYLTQGAGYWSTRLYNDALTKIVRGYVGATESKEIKTDEGFFKILEHNDRVAQMQNQRDIAQMNINKIQSGGSSGGMTLSVDPENGQIILVPAATTGTSKGSPIKQTEEARKLEELNAKFYVGDQNTPKVETKGYLDKLYATRKSTEASMNKSSLSFIDKVLASEYPEIGALITKGLEEQYKFGTPKVGGASTNEPEKWENKGLNGIVSKEFNKFAPMMDNPSKDIAALTPREAAFKTFVVKYGKEFQTYLQKIQNPAPTYLSMQGFLFDKAKTTYLSGKSSIAPGSRAEIDVHLDVLDRGLKILSGLDKDVKHISNNILDPAKKIVQPLTVVNDNGSWRFKTKEELRQAFKYNSEVVSTEGGGVNAMGDYEPPIEIYRNAPLAKQYESLYDNYDKNIADFNKQVPIPPSLTFSADQFQLGQYGVYQLKDVGSVKGEDAEGAITSLLAIADNDYAGTDVDKRPATGKAIDDSLFDGISPANIKAVIGILKNTISTSEKDNAVEYYQYTGLQDDDRKKYVIRFNNEYLESKISALGGEAGKPAIYDKNAKDQMQALKIIQQNGLTVFADDTKGIAGSLSGEYNIFEKTLQESMTYKSPDFANDRYQYSIRKGSDGTYELSGKYFVNDLDKDGNTVSTPIPLANSQEGIVKFPYKASFTSIINSTNSWITEQLKTASELYTQKLKLIKKENPNKFMSEADLEKAIRSQIQQ